MSKMYNWGQAKSEWASSFLTANHHNIGYGLSSAKLSKLHNEMLG